MKRNNNSIFARLSVIVDSVVSKSYNTIPVIKPKEAKVSVIKKLDTKRYMGKWYSIADIPQNFIFVNTKDCSNTTAEYKLNKDGTVSVKNTCMADGEIKQVKGTAYNLDKKNDGKLQVSFSPILKKQFSSDYNIIATDYNKYAVVGSNNKKALWLMSRTKTIDKKTYNKMLRIAKAQGYDITGIRKVKHM